MKVVLVTFEVFIQQDKEKPFVGVTPDYLFSGEFDKDNDQSLSSLCDLEFHVVTLAQSFKALGCRVSVLRKEVFHLVTD